MTALKLKPFQTQGVDFLVRNRRAILADATGLGKTPQAIMAARALSARRTLVVAPLSTLPGLANEIRRWWPDAPPVRIYRRKDKLPEGNPEGWFLIPWTDLTFRVAEIINGRAYQLIIGDEVHLARNITDAKMAQAWYGYRKTPAISGHAPRCWGMTATPMPNGLPVELLPMFDFADAWKHPDSRKQYLRHHCARRTHFGEDLKGARGLDQIHAYLKRCGWFLRREAADVPGELPDLQRIDVPIALPPPASSQSQVVDPDTIPVDPLALPGLEDWSRYRAALGQRKAVGTIAWLEDWLESNPNQSIVIFTHHKETARTIGAKWGIKPITGDDSPEDRQRAVDYFASTYGQRIFIATMASCGTGMNGLHRMTNTCAFAELDTVPSVHHQAEGRVRRIGGMGGNAIAYYLHGADSPLDAHVARILTRKTGWILESLPADLTEEARALFT